MGDQNDEVNQDNNLDKYKANKNSPSSSAIPKNSSKIAENVGNVIAPGIGGTLAKNAGKIQDALNKAKKDNNIPTMSSDKKTNLSGKTSSESGKTAGSGKNSAFAKDGFFNKKSILDPEDDSSSDETGGITETSIESATNVNIIDRAIAMWKKIPSFIRPIIPAIAGYVVMIIGFLLLTILIIAAPAALVQSVLSDVTTFGEKIGNLFTFKGFQTDREVAIKKENEFYEMLESTQEEFREKYNVEIDLEMITATLFYNRMLGDYTKDQLIDSDDYEEEYKEKEDAETVSSDKELAEFYDVAKGHIKTLARYMLIENITNSSCSDKPSQTITPKTEKEMAQNWYFWGGFDNQRKIDNVYSYNKSFPYCAYKGDKPGYRNYYEQIDTRLVELQQGGSSDELADFYDQFFNKETEIKVIDGVETEVETIVSKKSCSEIGGVIEEGQCYYKKSSDKIYTVSYQKDSVYYHRLMSPMKKVFSKYDNKTFIELYYPDYVGEETREKDIQRIVDGIYDLYEFIKKNGGINPIIGDIGVASGPWYTWKQSDAAWGQIRLGSSSATIYWYGCLMTSIAMQMAASGTTITLPNFNPGTFVAAMPNAFDHRGNWIGGNTWASFAPNFKIIYNNISIPGDTNAKAAAIADYIRQGYYVVARVKYTNQHWVAVTGVENGKIIMADPGGSGSTDMFLRYPETLTNSLTIKVFRG